MWRREGLITSFRINTKILKIEKRDGPIDGRSTEDVVDVSTVALYPLLVDQILERRCSQFRR